MKMASVFAAGGAAGPSEVPLRSSAAPQIPISRGLELAAAVKAAAPIASRFNKNALKLQIRRRWPVVFASKSNPSDGDSIDYKSSGEIKVRDTTQGPPLLTIFAGFLVFFLVFWIVGSILLWLISLVGALPPSK